MSKYEIIKPTYGSQIRVNRGLYYHHGIYIDDNNIVQFGTIDSDSVLDPSKARIILCTLKQFLRDGILETRVYNEDEKQQLRSPQEIVNYALSCLGNGGYDIINNNCEHFSNDCAFGHKSSSQVNNIKDIFSKMFGGNNEKN